MKRMVIVGMTLLSLAGASAQASQIAPNLWFKLTNSQSSPIVKVVWKRATNVRWGHNAIQGAVYPGEILVLPVRANELDPCNFDFKVLLDNGRTFTWENKNICKIKMFNF